MKQDLAPRIVENSVPEKGMFGMVTPAMVYDFLKVNANLTSSGEYVADVVLPNSVEIHGQQWHPNGNGYFVQTRNDDGLLVDAGVVTINSARPEIYVVTARSDVGEYSRHRFQSGENASGRRVIRSEQLGIIEEVTLEDVLEFAGSWTKDQKEEVLKAVVKQHYRALNPVTDALVQRVAGYLTA